MRDFNFKDDANIGAANLAPEEIMVRPVPDEIPREVKHNEILNQDLNQEDSSLRPFHVEQEDEESSNLPKLIGAAVVAVLIVGGGIYAYESTHASQTPKQVAVNTPTKPATQAANVPAAPPSATDTNAVTPPPLTPPPAAPVSKNASVIPASPPEPVKQAARAPIPGVGIGPTDNSAINAPMSFTADNAPPPQQPGTSGTSMAAVPAQPGTPQTALLQQPITPPNVPGNSAEPGSSVASAQGVTPPSDQASAPQAPRQLQPSIQPAQ